MPQIRTVLGDIYAEHLGTTNYHEHLFQVSPLLPGDELDDAAASAAEAALLRDSGFAAMVDATPFGLGRRPDALAAISEHVRLHVVATTGRHREEHYPPDDLARAATPDALAALFVSDIAAGMPADDRVPSGARAVGPHGAPVRAGILKAGIGYWSISAFEQATLLAVADAHLATGAPVMVHLEFCTAAHEVLDLLEARGVAPERVVLAHADRDPDPHLHTSLAARGAYLGYDGMARPRTRSEAELLTLTESVVAAGASGRILLGGDVARRTRYVSYGGLPGLAYLGTRYVPRLRERLGDGVVDEILRANPARFLAFDVR